jgi:hypothetical protein
VEAPFPIGAAQFTHTPSGAPIAMPSSALPKLDFTPRH